jgi:hypothetical protein
MMARRMSASDSAVNAREEKKAAFFFGKKNQKTLAVSGVRCGNAYLNE